ncbi:MAG TPA: S8 family serine peptidase [Chroococcales cyanobacterium]
MRAKNIFLPILFFSSLLGGCAMPTAEALKNQAIVRFREGLTENQKNILRLRYGVKKNSPLLSAELWECKAGLEELRKDSSFTYAQPNFVRRLQAFSASNPVNSLEWFLPQIHAPEAWARFTGVPGAGVTVAVVDSGVDPDHPDLKDNLLPLVDEVGVDILPANNVDYKGKDGQGHGTHVCGIIAGIASAQGMTGVAPGVKILPVKVMKNDGGGDDFTIAKGLKDAVDRGAKIINLSVGGTEPSPILADAIAYAYRANVLMCVSAGNDGGPVNYPAAYPGVLAVGAVDVNGLRADYSSFGPELAMVAPGGARDNGIWSTLPTYECYLTIFSHKTLRYGSQAGTSMATPQVTAAAALILSREPQLTPAQLKNRLLSSTLSTSGFTQATGFGLLNVDRAIQWSSHDGGPQ